MYIMLNYGIGGSDPFVVVGTVASRHNRETDFASIQQLGAIWH
jgi:hypothetical protein